MAIKRPDIYEHNNPAYAIADSDFVRGGIRSGVSDLSSLYALSGNIDQLKEHSTIIYVSGETKYYILVDINNVGNVNGWDEFETGGGAGTITGGTNGLSTSGANIVLGGALTGNTTIDANGHNVQIIDVNEFQVSTSGNTTVLGIDNNGLIFSFSGGSVSFDDDGGLKYSADYSNNFTNRSLIDKAYADAIVSGLKPKAAVAVATTIDIDLTGGTFGGTIDSYSVQDLDRVLVKDQISGQTNGIYVYSGGSNTFYRSEDFDGTPIGEVVSGSYVWVLSGSSNNNSSWVLVTPEPIVVGDTPLQFEFFNHVQNVVSGTGINVVESGGTHVINVNGAALVGNSIIWSGNTFNVDVNSGTLNSALDSKLNVIDFNGFTGTTLPANYYNKTEINTFTGTTLPANYYNKTEINSYSANTNTLINSKLDTNTFTGYTAQTSTIIDNAITGGTNYGSGSEIYSGASQHNAHYRTLVGIGLTTVTTVGDEIVVSGGSNFDGTTNGLSLFSGNTYVGLGGLLIQDTTICGGYNLNLGNSVSGLTALCSVTPIFHVENAGGDSSINFSHNQDTPHFDVCLYGENADSCAGIILDVDINNGCFNAYSAPNSLCNSGLVLKTTDSNQAILDIYSKNNALEYVKEAWISSVCRMTCEGLINNIDSGQNIKTIMDYSGRSFVFSVNDSPILSVLSGGTARYNNCVTLLNDCDLVYKGYVDNATGGIGANNGLSREGDNIVLGGNLTGDTCVLIENNVLDFYGNNVGFTPSIQLDGTQNSIIVNGGGGIGVFENNSVILKPSATGSDCLNMELSHTSFESVGGTGIRYAGEYESTLIDTSLVTKKYVTSQVSGITCAITTANNGLTKVGQNVVLGGTLTGNTTINGGTRNLTYSNINGFSTTSVSNIMCGTTSMLLRSPSITIHNGIDEVITINSTCNIFTDSANLRGFVYANNYCGVGKTNPRWIPDNEYITGLTSQALQTVSNGLTEVGTNVKLGGTLVENTNILGAGQYTFSLRNSGATTCTVGEFSPTNINLCARNVNSPNQTARITVTSNAALICHGFANCYSCMNMSNSMIGITFCGGANNANFTVTDATSTPRGIEYGACYHGTYSDRSLVDKQYVTSQVSGITENAITGTTNGLTKVGQDIVLGGILTGNTTIISNNNQFNVCGTNSNIRLSSASVNLSGNTVELRYNGLNKLTVNGSGIGIDGPMVFAQCKASYLSNLAPFTGREIPDAAWVTGLFSTSGVQTAVNGLTKTGTEVGLGGTLTGNTMVCLNSHNLVVEGVNNKLSLFGGEATLEGTTVYFRGVNTYLYLSDSTYGNLLADNRTAGNRHGLEYYDDYSDDYTVRSLVDKQYVDETISGATSGITGAFTTANNGLCSSGQIVSLGGILTGNTTISGAHVLALDSLTAFNTTATNINLIGITCICGNAEISSTLEVNDSTTINSTLTVTGNTVLEDGLNVSGSTNLGSGLTIGNVLSGSVNDAILVWNNADKCVKRITASGIVPTAANGLSVDEGNIVLGGILTGNTIVSGGTYSLYLGDSSSSLSNFHVNVSDTTQIQSNIININADSIASYGGGDFCLGLDNDAIFYDNSVGKDGLKYSTCISTGFTNSCSLVDKGYVDTEIVSNSNTVDVNNVTANYLATQNDDFIGVSGATVICLPTTPKPCQRIIVADICGNALGNAICIIGNGLCINGNSFSTINTDYGAMTFINNGFSWSAVAFIN